MPSAFATIFDRHFDLIFRRLLLAGAFACALALLLVVVPIFGQGGRVEPAAAAVLHQVASVAGEPRGNAGSKDDPRSFTSHVPNVFPDARPALVSTMVEKWISPDGSVLQRESLAAVKFFSSDDQEEW